MGESPAGRGGRSRAAGPGARTPRLFLLDDDRAARGWRPFSLTRPIGETLFGTLTLRRRAERALGLTCEGHLTEAALADFDEPGAPPCVPAADVGTTGDRLVLSSRLAVDAAPGDLSGPSVLALGSEPAGVWVPAGVALPPGLGDGDWPSWPRVPVEGALLANPWELMALNGDRIRADGLEASRPGGRPDPGVRLVGSGRVSLGPDATIEPGVVADTRSGPIVLDRGARVLAPARVCGPLYVGPGSTILGGTVAASSVGPACKIRGEVESSVILGYANKAHDGFLGHSVAGRWVNLGALTTNSDLKVSYGSVRAPGEDGLVDTGLLKAGCLLGDHVRTGIGALLHAGTTVGAGSVLVGPGALPRSVAPFTWIGAEGQVEVDVDGFVRAARRVMARRDATLTPAAERLYRRAHARTAAQRSSAARPVVP